MPHSTKKIKKRTSRAVVNQNNNLQTERNIKHSEWSIIIWCIRRPLISSCGHGAFYIDLMVKVNMYMTTI